MKIYTTRNRRRWAFGVAFSWERYTRRSEPEPMVIVQFGPYVAWLTTNARKNTRAEPQEMKENETNG